MFIDTNQGQYKNFHFLVPSRILAKMAVLSTDMQVGEGMT